MSNLLREVRRYATVEDLSRAAAVAVCAEAEAAIKIRGRFAAAVAGGHTPTRLYDALAAPPLRDRLDWSKVHLYFGDERAVPPDDLGSNFRMLVEHLLSRVAIPKAQIHRIEADAPDIETAAVEYASVVTRNVKPARASGPPSFDVMLLGLGADGHTASLFPGSPALAETQRWFVPAKSPVPPFVRVTSTLPLINAARQVFVLVSGAQKAEALAAVLGEAEDGQPLPAQLVAPQGRLVFFVDDAAAGRESVND